MPALHLSDRAIVDISGPDAETLLQAVITPDLDTLSQAEMRAGALLTPQGRILFDFVVTRIEGGFRFDLSSEITADFQRRMLMYKLRAKAEIEPREDLMVIASWGDDQSGAADSRFGSDAQVFRAHLHHAEFANSADDDAYHLLRIEHGVAQSPDDYALSDIFPHDVLFDQNQAVGMKKGCYVGQEVVSRMQHRGTARKRLMIARSTAEIDTNAGNDIQANGRSIGQIGTSVGACGLAIVRTDRLAATLDADQPVTLNGGALTFEFPDWADLAIPQQDN